MNKDSYPWLEDLESKEAQEALARARQQYLDTGAVTFPHFLTTEALNACAEEAKHQEDAAFTTDDTHTAYLKAPDPAQFASNSVYNLEMRTQVASIAFDELSQGGGSSKLAEFYHHPALLKLVSTIVDKTPLHLSKDPLGCCSINVFRPSYHHSFHFDESEFSTTLMLQAPDDPTSGLFQYTDPLRQNSQDLVLEDVAQCIDQYAMKGQDATQPRASLAELQDTSSQCPRLHTLDFQPGTLSIFSGSTSLHRVTRVRGTRSRLVAVLTFSTVPNFCNSAKVQKLFWGRSVPAPLEPYLVGLSPHFWAHVPLTIRQLQSLVLVEGLHCMLFHDDNESSNDNHHRTVVAARPLSKCRLLGTIVAMERKGVSTIYVLDDGTGVVDVVHWTSANEDPEALLPPLLPDNNPNGVPSSSSSCLDTSHYEIGQLVQVHGRIECACILVDNSKTTTSISLYGRDWEVRQCLHEIRANLIQPIPSDKDNPKYAAQTESTHWKQAMQTHADIRASATSCAAEAVCDDRPSSSFLDGCQMSHVLGPCIQKQIADLTHLPASNEHAGAWQLYGPRCSCHTLPYKDALLYCHCMATPLEYGLDSELVYRDALLMRLLELEQKTEHESAKRAVGEDGEAEAVAVEPLRFQYNAVVNDPHLRSVAQQVSNGSDLAAATFRALRADQVVYLLDEDSDTYLLLSKKRAIESYLQKMRVQPGYSKRTMKPPVYWSHISKQRIQYVKQVQYQKQQQQQQLSDSTDS